MSALASFRDTKQSNVLTLSTVKLGAGKKVFAGGIVVTDTATGYGCAGKTGTGLVCRGIAMQDVDNTSGGNGALSVGVDRRPAWLDIYGSDAVTQADVDKTVFLYDDHTIARTDGSAQRSIAGVLRAVGTLGALVEFSETNGDQLAVETAARQALIAALALTTTPGGASLIGLYDAADKFVATTVEAALAEAIAGKRIAATANDATVGGVPVVHTIAVADAASGTKTVMLHATYGALKILDVHFVKAGSAGGATDSIKLTDGTHDITDSLDLNSKAAGAIVRAASVSPTYGSLAAGATLVANWTKTTNGCEGTLVITGVRA